MYAEFVPFCVQKRLDLLRDWTVGHGDRAGLAWRLQNLLTVVAEELEPEFRAF